LNFIWGVKVLKIIHFFGIFWLIGIFFLEWPETIDKSMKKILKKICWSWKK